MVLRKHLARQASKGAYAKSHNSVRALLALFVLAACDTAGGLQQSGRKPVCAPRASPDGEQSVDGLTVGHGLWRPANTNWP